jgi:hypothetical protein
MKYEEILLKIGISMLVLFAACSLDNSEKLNEPETVRTKHVDAVKSVMKFQFDALNAPADYLNYDYHFQQTMVNRYVILDTLITSLQEDNGKWYINGIVSNGSKAEVFVSVECSQADYEAISHFPYSEKPRAIITAAISKIQSFSDALLLQSEDVYETFIGSREYLKVSGKCLQMVLIPSLYYYKHIFGER